MVFTGYLVPLKFVRGKPGGIAILSQDGKEWEIALDRNGAELLSLVHSKLELKGYLDAEGYFKVEEYQILK